MRIYRGNIGIDLTLEEFEQILADDDKMDDLLNIIYEMEMDEAMQYDKNDIEEFEKELLEEAAKYQEKKQKTTDSILMKRIVNFLGRYGKQ